MEPLSHGLLRLPYDTLHKILKPLKEDYKRLRLVCTHLNDVVEPELLSCLAIHQNTLKPDAYQLEILATGRSQAASFARTLNIHSSCWPTNPEAEARMKQYLGLAISSLVQLRSVRWIVSSSVQQWVQDAIIDAVTNLPLLKTLQLSMTYHSSSSLRLNRLSGLKGIAISVVSYTRDQPLVLDTLANAIGQSPGLTHLELHPGSFGISEIPSLHELVAKVPHSTPLQLTHLLLERVLLRLDALTVPHLRSLTFLDLSYFSPLQHDWLEPSTEFRNRYAKHHSTLTDIFVTLARERIHLRGLIVHEQCNTAIVKYIGSYSGMLEHLEISHFSPDNFAESHALAELFYTFALPKHASTMQRLRILHDCNHEWNRHSESMFAISQCKKLLSLEVKLYLTGRYAEDEGKLDDVIISLADVSLALPHLSLIHLGPAEARPSNSWRCGTGIMQKYEEDYYAIKRSIERFTLRLGDNEAHGPAALPDLVLGSRLYKFEAAPGAGVAGEYTLFARNVYSYDPFGSGVFKLPRDGH